MKRITFVAAIALAGAFGLAGCHDAGVKGDAAAGSGNAEYDAAVATAKAEQKKAGKAGGEWRDIGKFLKQADEAAKKGDFDKAMKLVKKATFEAKMGQEQAAAEANAGNPAYLK